MATQQYNQDKINDNCFKTINLLEEDGWELLNLDVTDNGVWFADMIRDGVSIYMEFGNQKTGLVDINKYCEKCLMPLDADADDCAECGSTAVFDVKIHEAYQEFCDWYADK